jgi:PTS system mannose-specific IIA component
MIGVVVATHGKLAEELIRTAEAVVGKIELVAPVSIVATSPDVRGDLKAAIQRVDQGEGVLLLTDIFGGSPTNLCLSFLTERQVEVVTGVNLPMLLKLPELRAHTKGGIVEVAQKLVDAGQKSVSHASEALRRMM